MTYIALEAGVTTFVVVLLIALLLIPLARGEAFRRMASRAPGLDVVVFLLTVAPWLGGTAHAVWRSGLETRATLLLANVVVAIVATVLAQSLALIVWCRIHELLHRRAARGPRIVKTLNAAVGTVRNHTALWWTAIAVPAFAIVRLTEIFLYPPLHWLVRLPAYRSAEWINVSRHKFDGLVGYDLVWCLYCDWMTGVWCLGTEMLRNVESFWCPIRFSSPEKCANCRVDFPDVDGGWVSADGTMQDVVDVVAAKYPGPGGVNAWFGHEVRLTVNGEDTPPPPEA